MTNISVLALATIAVCIWILVGSKLRQVDRVRAYLLDSAMLLLLVVAIVFDSAR
ncbi:MAG: hypothetical protein ABFD89_30255 [Bryobacteraceae bacterium]